MAQSGKRPSRKRLEAEALERAARQEVPETADVCVIGGGAAGLVAAITAAEAGASTVVLEARTEAGRSILATGNGRCNFANLSIDQRRYSNWDFVDAVFGGQPLDDILAFFRASGLRWELEGDRLYPMSFQAASVRNVLLARAEKAGVKFGCARAVTGIEQCQDGSWDVAFVLNRGEGSEPAPGQISARAAIIACGPSAPFLDAAASALALVRRPLKPALCPITCAPSPLLELDGRRVHGALSLVKGMFPTWHERGEVMLRSYGLSGVVTFNLSRRAVPGDAVLVDLVPDLSKGELRQLVDPMMSGRLDDRALDGIIDPQIASLVVSLARKRWEPDGIDPDIWGAKDTDDDSTRAIALAKALPFTVTGFQGAQAQIMAGGLDVSSFSSETLEHEAHAGLYAAGEALDVDGDCGGYNLMWAWKSGMVAGFAAAQAATR